jgi:hypothetical protein
MATRRGGSAAVGRRATSFVIHGVETEGGESWWVLPLDRQRLVVSHELGARGFRTEDAAREAACATWPRGREICDECWTSIARCEHRALRESEEE